MTILVCDDDKEIVDAIEIYLIQEGYQVVKAYDGEQALEMLRTKKIYLMVIDVMMPKLDGIRATFQARKTSSIPIIILSAKSEDADKILGLNIGADDYITKPFRPLVLGAKVKALIRRTKNMGNHSDTIQCGPFTYESSTMRFYNDGEELMLSSKESALLLLFIKHPGQVYTKDMIYEQVWGTTIAIDDNAIMVYINRLRSKIEKDRQKPEHIITVRGMGYRFLP